MIKKISDKIWELPKVGKMKVPGRVFASKALMEKIKQDKTLQQVRNVAALPGISRFAIAMPDAHQGYGFPVGGVAAFDEKQGIISPGGIGYDINCGVRLLASDLRKDDFIKKKEEVADGIFKAVPSGVGKGSDIKVSDSDLSEVLENGVSWAVKKGFASEQDRQHCEDSGCIKGADEKKLSQRARARGKKQLGTLGAGNHFLEIQEVETIFDKDIAKTFGLKQEGQITVLIHSGSRGLGHQTASDYIKSMEDTYGFSHLPDRELACAPISSGLGRDYIKAMAAAANFAFTNRTLIMHQVRKSFERHFPKAKLDLIYDVAHNIAKFEEFMIDGKKVQLCIHRKGATRSFGHGRKELPEKYRKTGQPIFIPGSMGTYSYVLAGTERAKEVSFASTAHGAGRVWSRKYAKEKLTVRAVKESLRTYGVYIKSGSDKGIVEEAAEAYKDVNEVVRVSDELGIGKPVARLRPLAVVKG